MILSENRIRFPFLKLKNDRNYLKIRDFQDNCRDSDDHNFGTGYARNLKFTSKRAVLDTIHILPKTQFRPKVDLGPFGNELVKTSNFDMHLERIGPHYFEF